MARPDRWSSCASRRLQSCPSVEIVTVLLKWHIRLCFPDPSEKTVASNKAYCILLPGMLCGFERRLSSSPKLCSVPDSS